MTHDHGSARDADMGHEAEEVLLPHTPCHPDRFPKRVLGAELLREDDHHLVTDVLVHNTVGVSESHGRHHVKNWFRKASVSAGFRSSVLAE